MNLIVVVLIALMAGLAPAFSRDLYTPDPKLTPGVATNLTVEEICAKAWGKDVRHVTEAMKREVFSSQDIKCSPLFDGPGLPACKTWEIDHSISRELGGADDVRNLWAQLYTGPWNARMKDRLENRLHKEVCERHLDLEKAQSEIAVNWPVAYSVYFGEPSNKRNSHRKLSHKKKKSHAD